MHDSLLVPETFGKGRVFVVDVFENKLVLLRAVWIHERNTFDNKTHAWVFALDLFIVSTEDKDLVFVERSPSTAAQKSKLSLVFDGGINFSPQIGTNAVHFKCVVILARGMNTSKFEQIVISYSTKTGIGCLVLAWCHSFHFVSLGKENFAFFQSLVIVSHAATNVDNSLMAQDWMRWSSN